MNVFERLVKAAVVTLCVFGVTAHVHAENFKRSILDSSGGLTWVGTQVKIERFTPSAAKQIRAAGFTFVRFGVWVNAMHASDYQQRVANAFTAAQGAGLPVLLTVRSTVPLLRSEAEGTERDTQLVDAATDLTRVVSSLDTEYGNNLLAIELWNEPDLPKYWPTGNVETTLPPYMRAVCAGLATVHASTNIVGFGFATAPAFNSPSDKLLKALQPLPKNCFDAVSYHAYGMTERQIQATSDYVRSEYGLAVVITEWGFSSGAKGGVTGQAAAIESFLAKRALLKTPLISIYEWQDTENADNVRERNFGLTNAAGASKPAFDAALKALRQP